MEPGAIQNFAAQRTTVGSSKREEQTKRPVHVLDGLGAKAPRIAREALRIDRPELLDHDAALRPVDLDRRPKRRRPSGDRRRRHDHRGQGRELVRLEDDGVAAPALLVATRPPRGRKPIDVTTVH